MILPSERTVYANLSTSFVVFSELLLDLKASSHSGFVRVDFPQYRGVVFLVAGEAVHAVEEWDGGRQIGQAAAQGVRVRAAERAGLISVDQAAPEIVRLIAQMLDSEPLYKDLTSAFTSLEKLFGKLQQDAVTGYIEILLADGSGSAMVLFEEGNPVESMFASGTETFTGYEARAAVVHSVNTIGGSFNVYRVAGIQAGGQQPVSREVGDPAPLLAFWSEVLEGVEEVADGLSAKGRFRTALREVFLSRIATFPFLDPFAAEFNYQDGRVTVEGPIPADLSKGLGACLGDTVAKLAFQLKRADLESRVRDRLAGISEKHAAVIARWDLGEDVLAFVA